MTTLVERLGMRIANRALMEEAAATIARLEAALVNRAAEALNESERSHDAVQRAEAAEAEVVRLREALAGLVDAIDYWETPKGRRSYAILGTMPPAFHCARAALQPDQGEPT
jgi:hypothetical protein